MKIGPVTFLHRPLNRHKSLFFHTPINDQMSYNRSSFNISRLPEILHNNIIFSSGRLSVISIKAKLGCPAIDLPSLLAVIDTDAYPAPAI